MPYETIPNHCYRCDKIISKYASVCPYCHTEDPLHEPIYVEEGWDWGKGKSSDIDIITMIKAIFLILVIIFLLWSLIKGAP